MAVICRHCGQVAAFSAEMELPRACPHCGAPLIERPVSADRLVELLEPIYRELAKQTRHLHRITGCLAWILISLVVLIIAVAIACSVIIDALEPLEALRRLMRWDSPF